METVVEIELYKRMLKIRVLEDELQRLCLEGDAGDLHFSKGQEAISVGACAALRPTDYIVTHHRTIAHSVSRGMPLKPLVAEILGRESGVNGGMAGEMHISYPKLRYMFSFQLVGTCVPVAAGLAWTVKNYLKGSDIVACFFGDAATSNAQFHEGLNIASVRKAPLLMLCENNGLAGNIRPEFYLPTKTIAERAKAYGIESSQVDGNHLDEVMQAVSEASTVVRETSKPYIVDMNTTRLCWHKQGQPDARSKSELAELAKRDPLLYEERRLELSEAQKEDIKAEISQEVKEAIQYALGEQFPSLPSAK